MIFYYNAWSNDCYKEPLLVMLASIVNDINSSKNFELLVNEYKESVKRETIAELKISDLHNFQFGVQGRKSIMVH